MFTSKATGMWLTAGLLLAGAGAMAAESAATVAGDGKAGAAPMACPMGGACPMTGGAGPGESMGPMMGGPGSGRAVLGVAITADDDDKAPAVGVTVVGLMPGGPAENAGLQADDLILSINGQSFKAPTREEANRKLLRFMASVNPGEELKVAYRRGGKDGTVKVEATAPPPRMGSGTMLEAMPGMGMPGHGGMGQGGMMGYPGMSDGMPDGMRMHQGAFAGLQLVEISEGLGRYFGTTEGLLVVRAPAGRDIPIEDGDVILAIGGRTPGNRWHADRILGSYAAGEKLTLQVMRDKKKKELSFAVPESVMPMPMPMPMPGPGR